MPRIKKDASENFSLPEETKKSSQGAVFILLILLLLSIGGLVWSFSNYKKAKSQITFLSTQEGQLQVAEQEVQALLDKVRKHILLPEGEPVVATIQDAAALSAQQAFYLNSQNDDKLIIYKDKAIIYSPARDLVVNVGPVFIQEGDQLKPAAEVLDQADARMKVEFRNGTKTAGLARTQADSLDAKVYNVIGVNAAANTEYTRTVVVNLKGANVSDLEKKFGVSAVNQLPAGEAPSDADVLIIMGQ